MSGKILVIDAMATNRILLRVQLASAFYQVLQADTVRDARNIAELDPPDLILANAELCGYTERDLIRAFRSDPKLQNIPISLMLPTHDPARRLAALQAGADDVITKPVDGRLMLARLRCLLRQQHAEHDLLLHAGAAEALGFAEPQREFVRHNRIVLISGAGPQTQQIRTVLMPDGADNIQVVNAEKAVELVGQETAPDLFLLAVGPENSDERMRLIAEFKAAPRTRYCPIVAFLDEPAEELAPAVLDIGVNDTLTMAMSPAECRIRVGRQLKYKHAADLLRCQLRNGLNAAIIDPLTGLYNRRYALPYLSRLVEDAGAGSRCFAVMVADLDYFKRVNDRFGHAAGDEVLRQVAGLLRRCLGEDGLAARIGGEEFLIVRPDTARADARRLADHLCDTVSRTPILVAGCNSPVQVTISIGVTMAQVRNGTRPSVDTLLDEADRALYSAKGQGRNTVTFSTSSQAA